MNRSAFGTILGFALLLVSLLQWSEVDFSVMTSLSPTSDRSALQVVGGCWVPDDPTECEEVFSSTCSSASPCSGPEDECSGVARSSPIFPPTLPQTKLGPLEDDFFVGFKAIEADVLCWTDQYCIGPCTFTPVLTQWLCFTDTTKIKWEEKASEILPDKPDVCDAHPELVGNDNPFSTNANAQFIASVNGVGIKLFK